MPELDAKSLSPDGGGVCAMWPPRHLDPWDAAGYSLQIATELCKSVHHVL